MGCLLHCSTPLQHCTAALHDLHHSTAPNAPQHCTECTTALHRSIAQKLCTAALHCCTALCNDAVPWLWWSASAVVLCCGAIAVLQVVWLRCSAVVQCFGEVVAAQCCGAVVAVQSCPQHGTKAWHQTTTPAALPCSTAPKFSRLVLSLAPCRADVQLHAFASVHPCLQFGPPCSMPFRCVQQTRKMRGLAYSSTRSPRAPEMSH